MGGPGGGEQRLGQLQTPGRRLPRLPGTGNTQTPSEDSDQVLHKHGVSDENIITMIYDDIAHSPDNPHKGEIYNQPGGENVYAGFKKGELNEQYLFLMKFPLDYTGEDVTAENFLAVLKGRL